MNVLLYLIVLTVLLMPIYLVLLWRQAKEDKVKKDWLDSLEYTTLRIDVPRNNEKAPLAAEQMFAAIHGIYADRAIAQYHLSFEIVARDKYIQFYVYLPKQLKDFIEGQVYAQYPNVEISQVDDYTAALKPDELNYAVCELSMTKPDVYPLKLFSDFEVDPISGITSVMSNLANGESVWLQMLARPVGDDWQEKGNSIISAVRAGKKTGSAGALKKIVKGFSSFSLMVFMQAVKPGAEIAESKTEIKLPGTVEDALKAIEYKIMKLGFETKLRVLSIGNDPVTAKVKCQNVAAAFKQYNTTNLNGFKLSEIVVNDKEKWAEYLGRKFEGKGNILNIAELASIYHFPHQTVTTPNIVWSGSKKAEPPANLPTPDNTDPLDLTVIGLTNFRNQYKKFGIQRDDRRRHIYIIGKSGTGKSTLIENMAIDDVVENRGVIVVDPHGDLAEKLMACVPDHRVKDVIVFDPADRAHPIAFNLLEHVDDDFKGMVASGFVGIFKKIFGESWGPRLEHILRNTVLALLDFPESTMLDIPKMLTDNHFRDKVINKVKDPVIKDFWVNEFSQYDSKFRTEAVSPILNKVGQFLATSTIRNIVGQPHSRIDIREIMDQEKIMVVNLSRGKIGEDNSSLLGAMMITKIQLAAMSRADVTSDKRPDCYLYVDEFQNFATDSFAVILSEARKYNLNLTMANQYIEQMPEAVRSAVFGNAGTIITFRVGGTDASFLVKEYEPVFEQNDLVNLDKYQVYIKLLVNGISSPAFSAKTLPPIQRLSGNAEKVIEFSREHYSTDRTKVENMIAERTKEDEEDARREAELFKQGGLEALLTKREVVGDAPAKPSVEPIKDGPIQKAVSAPSAEIAPENEKMGESAHILPPASLGGEEGTEGQPKKKKKKKRVFRYQNIVGNTLYKEQTGRGGTKWYVGEVIDFEKIRAGGLSINDDAKKMIELSARVAGLGTPVIPTREEREMGETARPSSNINTEDEKDQVVAPIAPPVAVEAVSVDVPKEQNDVPVIGELPPVAPVENKINTDQPAASLPNPIAAFDSTLDHTDVAASEPETDLPAITHGYLPVIEQNPTQITYDEQPKDIVLPSGNNQLTNQSQLQASAPITPANNLTEGEEVQL